MYSTVPVAMCLNREVYYMYVAQVLNFCIRSIHNNWTTSIMAVMALHAAFECYCTNYETVV